MYVYLSRNAITYVTPCQHGVSKPNTAFMVVRETGQVSCICPFRDHQTLNAK